MVRKVTFTLDDETLGRLGHTADRLGKSKSQVVREAIYDYSQRVGRLSERERLRLLAVFDEVTARIPRRSVAEVEKEIQEIRKARRASGRRSQRGA
ncbi:MAG TPA: ribbon-helix-helix protein, CopG family [Pyrinomonadaceae bacterium]|jgi:metal-responsive CopG/Arc/MetJ family transcriptional regulator